MKLSDLGTFHIALFMHKFRNVKKHTNSRNPLYSHVYRNPQPQNNQKTT